MASTYKCKWNDCSTESLKSWGSGMYFIHYICTSCFDDIYLPRFSPRESREELTVPKFLETNNFKTRRAINLEDVRRLTNTELLNYLSNSSRWRLGEDMWDKFEIATMLKLKKKCKCNSEFKMVLDEKILMICNNCHSDSFSFTYINSTD